MTKLRQIEMLVKFYFAPWGAAKGEIMEAIFDHDLTDDNVIGYIESILNNSFSFDEEDMKFMRVVAA